ncbi:MAG TPA: tetratricopeptide repeat protein [Desulfuromonadaceae bacterium]
MGPALFIILLIQCVAVGTAYGDADQAYERGDYAVAFDEYRIRAERGEARAQLRAGWMCYYGEGVRRDASRAMAWYRKAAEQGDVTAMFNLAYGYEHGEGVAQDLAESRRWYGMVAGQRNATERLDFQWLTKTFLTLDAAQERAAREWAERQRIRAAQAAAEAKRAAAEAKQAAVAAAGAEPAPAPAAAPRPVRGTGEGRVPPATPGAAERFREPRLERIRRAAESGDEQAQVALGWIYSSGQGTPVDKGKAAGWYRLAAEKGNLKAQVALGWMYYNGEGVERNLEEAAAWYGRAASRGNEKARLMLRKIERILRRTAT